MGRFRDVTNRARSLGRAQPPQLRAGRQRIGQLLLEDVDRDRDEDRASRRSPGLQEGAPHQNRKVVDLAHLDRVLEGPLRDRDQVSAQHRVLEQVAAILLARGDHQRGAGAAGVQDHAQPVREPGGDVQVQKCGPAAGAGEPVGHRDRRRLVQAEAVLQVRGLGKRIHERKLGGAGVAEDVLDALASQQLDQRGGGLHKPTVAPSRVVYNGRRGAFLTACL